MKEQANGALDVPPKDEAIDILMNMEPQLNKTTDLEVAYIDNIDSSNMTPGHWKEIATKIYEKYDDYDGFVITHGTDTMGYTSSALSFALQNLGKPVILTGAQIPGCELGTDARRNFTNAVRLATMDISGIMIVFDEEIILGARASKVSESKLDAFETINWDLLGEIRIDIRLSKEAKTRNNNSKLILKPDFDPHIAVVTLIPGTPVPMLLKVVESGIHGLFLRGYGPGNIAYDYLKVLKRANELKIPVVLDTQCMEGSTDLGGYDVGAKALESGIIQAYDMSVECTSTKFMWALANYPYEKTQEIMHKNFVGELNKEKRIY